jgi:flagellar protein FlaF
MTQAAQAYGKTASQTTNPRDLEADLLLQAASQLQSIRDGWESKQSELNAALTNNRKLWSLLVATVTRPENPLPANIRQNVANIGIYVFKQTLTAMTNPKPENLGSLININRELASGLRGRA